MTKSLDEAILQFQQANLPTARRSEGSAVVGAAMQETHLGISVIQHATLLQGAGDHWFAQFSGPGQTTTDVEGPLVDLTDLILDVYRDYRQHSGPLHEAVARALNAQPRPALRRMAG